jgi:hypothetical protein
VKGGRIIYVGSDSVPDGMIGSGTEVVDLAGKMVLPGFQDGHIHLLSGGVELGECTLFTMGSAAAIADSIRACAIARPAAPWVRGVGWELTAFPDANPSRALLDRIVPDRPAIFDAADGHSAWANSKALDLAGITRDTPDPPDGRIERDPRTGEPSGTLRESAIYLVSRLLPERSDAELTAGLARAQRLANEVGITSAFEAWAPESYLRAYVAADLGKSLTVRIIAAADAEPDSTGIDSLIRRLSDWRALSTPRVRLIAVKLFQDGVIESGTAALLAPYLDRKGDAGKPIHPQPRLDSLAAALDREGWQIHVHAIGDRAIRMTLHAFERAMKLNGPRDSRHTITHLQLIDPADIPRFRTLGVVANFEPYWANGDEYITKLAEPALGRTRSRWLYPIGSVAKAGAVVSGGSDWSVSPLAPLDGMQVAITRRLPDDRTTTPWLPEEVVDLATAIAMYTINAAYANHQERETGSIEVGKFADLVVLEKNLFEVALRDIHRVRVMRTILEGRTVFERGSLAR